METVYIETTIPSYLAAHRSHQEPMALHQQITQDWWAHERMRFRLYSSIAVRAEITKGDASAAARRLKVMEGIPELDVTAEVQPLADSIVHFCNCLRRRRWMRRMLPSPLFIGWIIC